MNETSVQPAEVIFSTALLSKVVFRHRRLCGVTDEVSMSCNWRSSFSGLEERLGGKG